MFYLLVLLTLFGGLLLSSAIMFLAVLRTLCLKVLLILCLSLRLLTFKLINYLMNMSKVSSFVGTMPNAITLHNYMLVCCKRFIPFHYDPATKLFSAFPVCREDLEEMQDYYRYITNRDLNPLQCGLFNPNLNR